MKILYWFVIYTVRLWLTLCYRIKIHGKEHFPKGPALIASNHTSFLDPEVVAVAAPQEIHFLAKESLFKIPLLGWLIRKVNSHPVSASGQDMATFKVILQVLEEGGKVLIFPEGKRSFDETLLPFKPGAAMLALRANCAIIPTYIHGAAAIWGREKKYPHLFGKICCYFGPPIYAESFTHLSKKEAQQALTEALEAAMKKLQRAALG